MKGRGVDRKRWYVLIAIGLALLSLALYLIQFAIFHNAHLIYFYMLLSLAFLPLEVLFVTLIIDWLLTDREKRLMLEKMNMVIGAFYGEVGTELLRRFMECDPGRDEKREKFAFPGGMSEVDIARLRGTIYSLKFVADADECDLDSLKEFLLGRRDFMIRLLENPMLLEHESFTDILWAVFHLAEELDARKDLHVLPVSDMKHITGDMSRAYERLAGGWLSYMRHLEKNYPYLFSLAARLNPFEEEADPTVL
jgi:hypothetical protein